MNHISEDKLLEYALGTIESDSERADINTHLEKCSECRDRLKAINNDIDMLAGIKIERKLNLNIPMKPKRPLAYSMLKIAALFMVGYLAGLGTSGLFYESPVRVIPSYTKLSPPADSLANLAISDATYPGYYYIDIPHGN